MELSEGEKHGGLFAIDGKDRLGELVLAGRQTDLYIHDSDDVFRPNGISDRCILGILHDRTRVSLHQCNASPMSGSAKRGNEHYSFTNIFPHFVLHGSRHLRPAEREVRRANFTVDDASTIFYDFDAFGHAFRPRRHIRAITRSDGRRIDRAIPVGSRPEIAYFTGRMEIFSAKTALGKVSATDRLTRNWGGPEGVSIRSTITLSIEFAEPAVFEETIEAVSTLLQFLEIVAGRRQNLSQLIVEVGSPRKRDFLQVYWSLPPKREDNYALRAPHPSDLPLSGAKDPELFGRVLTGWLLRHTEWRDARGRFANSFAQQNSYSVDRLIGSANMFDLLPADAVPTDVPLSPEAQSARDQARELFKALPDTPQRNSVLGALGRMGQASLRDKIKHRARPVLKDIDSRLPGALEVLALAVDCRNHYVHGSAPRAPYSQNFFATVPFLTDALEFVFAASDLMDASWSLQDFAGQGSTGSHPFGEFLVSYDDRLRELNAVLPAKWRIGQRLQR